jgi:hypothetical protein
LCVQSQGASPGGAAELDAFLTGLQRALQRDDRPAIAGLIRYPITIAIAGFRVPFADAASVLGRYDDIFNPPLREAILGASAYPSPDRRLVAATPEAFVIGTNEVVIAPVDGQLRIVSMSVPDFAGGAPPAARSTDVPGAVRKPEPRRVAIRVGPRATQIPGLLARGATDVFMLYLPKGQLAAIRLERVRAGAATLRVVHARTGAPLGSGVSAGGRFVSGRPVESADYRIDVQWTSGDEEAPLPYMLSLSLR